MSTTRGDHRPPRDTVVAVLSGLLALGAGWYVVAMGWSVAFLLSESWFMAVYAVVLLLSPALFTIVAILAFTGRPRAALWVLVPLVAKWLVVFVDSFIRGGIDAVVAQLPVLSAINKLGDEFLVQNRFDWLVLSIVQFDVEPIALVVMVVLLASRRRR